MVHDHRCERLSRRTPPSCKRRTLPEQPTDGRRFADRLAVRDEIGRAIARLSADEQLVIGLRSVAT